MENKYKSKKYKSKKQKQSKRVDSIDLLDKRIIYIDGEIDDELAKSTVKLLLKLDMCNHRDITMYINSPGGSVSSGLAIYDVMNYVKSDIRTIGIGKCASMASILLINGAKGKRCLFANCEVMIHEVSSFSVGKVTEMQEKLDHSKTLNERIYKIIASKTHRTIKQIKKDTANKDSWMSSSKALRYGFVDKILR